MLVARQTNYPNKVKVNGVRAVLNPDLTWEATIALDTAAVIALIDAELVHGSEVQKKARMTVLVGPAIPESH